jgi:hypothetical protein
MANHTMVSGAEHYLSYTTRQTMGNDSQCGAIMATVIAAEELGAGLPCHPPA